MMAFLNLMTFPTLASDGHLFYKNERGFIKTKKN
jgi:hypothetical protein